MPAITVRNLSEETHRALKQRATRHGRSTEAEIREILDAAVRPQERLHMGDALAALGRRLGLTDRDLDFGRDPTPAKPRRFE